MLSSIPKRDLSLAILVDYRLNRLVESELYVFVLCNTDFSLCLFRFQSIWDWRSSKSQTEVCATSPVLLPKGRIRDQRKNLF